jgi:hypothetical protein
MTVKAKASKVGQGAMKVVGIVAMIALTTIVGVMFLGGVARYAALMEKADWTARDAVGAILIAFLMGFVVFSSVLAFLAAVIEGKKLGRKE